MEHVRHGRTRVLCYFFRPPLLALRKLGAALGAMVLLGAGFADDLATTPAPWWSDRGQPQPLTAEEEASPAAGRLARSFNPAMAFTDRGAWPVEVRYAWHDGADLVAKVMGRHGRVEREYVAVPNAELERRPWDALPARDPQGRPIRYTVDAPGDDQEEGGRTRWRARWDALVGRDTPAARPSAAAFPPTQYAHLFWWNRKEGLLAIQYWFFYPFNEWVNHHESDWEHVNVILKGPTTLDEGAAFEPVGCQFAFHGFRHDTSAVVRVGGPRGGEDHVVVFVGGRGRLLWWRGTMSGGSYPLPAVYAGVGPGPLSPDEDTRAPARFLAPGDFQVVQLPEPERLDARAHPALSWLKLPFYAGQDHMRTNPPLLDWLGFAGPVLQPGLRSTWNARTSKTLWPHVASALPPRPALPSDWPLIAAPWLPPPTLAARTPSRAVAAGVR
jgi:hypothetical protein